jgi:hypothetical protein
MAGPGTDASKPIIALDSRSKWMTAILPLPADRSPADSLALPDAGCSTTIRSERMAWSLRRTMTTFNILLWLDLHRQVYFWPVGAIIVLALAMAVAPFLREKTDARRGHDWVWVLVILAILVAGRWPVFFINRELNPDESQFLAGARVLLLDPVFSRSIDGETSGPLSFFALWPAGFVFGWHTYLTARITTLLLLTGAFGLAHQVMAILVGRQIARVAGLAAVCMEALTNASDLLHYSSELVPMALFSLAGYAAVRRWNGTGGWGWSGLGGLALGAAPLAKLQSVPTTAFFGLVWLVAEARSRDPAAARRCFYLIAGALLPAGLFAAQITLAGDWATVVLSYYSYNVHYTKLGAATLGQLLHDVLALSDLEDSMLTLYFPGIFLWLLVMARPVEAGQPRLRLGLAGAAVACGLAVCCIYLPHRPFLHYWQLLMVPLTFLVGAAVANLLSTPARSRDRLARWTVVAGASGLICALLLHRAQVPNSRLGSLSYSYARPRTELAAFVARHSRPGESIAIWGWSNYVYVEADLVQATQSPHFGRATTPGPYQQFFRHRFIANLEALEPALFLDSSGPSSLEILDDPNLAHDICFPELAAIIRAQYRLVGGVNGARLYRRIGPARRPALRSRAAGPGLPF